MDHSANYSGFIETLLESSDDYEPYGFSSVDDSLQRIYLDIQAYKNVPDEKNFE